MRFLADVGISPLTVEFLNCLGHDALHLYEQRLHRMKDPDILHKARSESRVLLTHDLDFGELMAASGAELPSVIIFRLRRMQPQILNNHLTYLISEFESDIDLGAILSVSERQVRVRHLPIERRVP